MSSERKLLQELAAKIKPHQIRPMREFAESEIVIPDGPFEGRKYSCARQPYSALYFSQVALNWAVINALGPTQSGKTLTCFVIPMLFHLFEVRETVLLGLPLMDMAADKWNEDFLPVIEKSRYRDLLPKNGPGSKGGRANLNSIQFSHGPTLRFMSGGGGDKSRAGFTSRVLGVTETDGLDESGGSSREADKLTQLIGRTRSYGDRARIYQECTVSLESGRTWRDYRAGTESRIAIKCPYCGQHVTPERKHLVGWQDASDVMEAGEKAAIACSDCGVFWSEEDRRTANLSSVLIHRGQTVNADGAVEGPQPRTNILGFRWTAANNMLVKTSTIGQDEWRASRSGNEENAEMEMCQFVWAEPYTPATIDLTQIDHTAIMSRADKTLPRGHCPDDTQFLVLGADVGKWLCHWVIMAFRLNATPHVVDYGRIEVPSKDMAEELAIPLALRAFRDSTLKDGFDSPAGRRHLQLGLIDSRYQDKSVYAFCDESSLIFPSEGYGSTQKDMKKFIRKGRDQCVGIGEEYQVVHRVSGQAGVKVEINTDYWKGWLHGRLQAPVGQPGAMTLFKSESPQEHLGFAKHLTAEKKVEEFIAGKGTVVRWHMLNRNNHWLDACAYACVAAHYLGARLVGQTPVPVPQPSAKPAPQTPRRPEPDDRRDFMPERPRSWTQR